MSHASKILIVDDLPAMSQLIATLLKGENYQLEFASTGAEALEKAAVLDPDLILLDIMMPDMNGFAVCHALRAMPRLAAVPIIMVTALDDRASRLAGLEAGADDFVSKPFDPAELRARVRAVTRMDRYRRLVAEQARYERLINLSPDGIFIMDQVARVRLANPAMLRLLGAEEAEVLARPIEEFIAPSQRGNCRQALGADRDVPTTKRFTSWFLRQDGSQFPVEINAGRFEWDGEPMIQAIVRDITERKQAEELLHRGNQELAMLNRASQRFVSSLDLHQVLSTVLEEVEALFDAVSASVWLEDSATGELVCWRAVGPDEDSLQGRRIPAGGDLVGRAFTTGETVLVADVQADSRHIRQVDQLAGLQHRSVLCVPFLAQNRAFGVLQLADGNPDRFGAREFGLAVALSTSAASATENALLFRAVNAQGSQLRALAGRLSEIREQERRALARELHDQIGQNLTVISLNLTMADQRLPPETHEIVRQRIDDSIFLLGETTRRMRNVMADLHPPVLDDYGLLAGLRWYGDQVAHRTGLTVQVKDSGVITRCSQTVETAFFRIAQEALNNVVKHAQASQVMMNLQREDGQMRLTIADNGKGFDVAAARQPSDRPHWGLLTMQERAVAIGGSCHVTSQPGSGTTVVVEVSP